MLPTSEFHKYAKSKGGKCLTLARESARDSLTFECAEKHIWETNRSVIKRGSWCHISGGSKKSNIEEMRRIAAIKFGKCISKEYTNAHTHLDWECALGHTWTAAPTKIKTGKWCPTCASGYGERLCRYVFEKLSGKTFKKIRPEWLRHNGNKLELDGYNEVLKIGFEHHGVQHYKKTTHFHQTINLDKRIELDSSKLKLCKANGVKVLVIPEIPTLTDSAISLIRTFLVENKVPVSKATSINLKEFYSSSSEKQLGEKYVAAILEKGGKIIGSPPRRATEKITIECNKKHRWTIAAVGILKSWCPVPLSPMQKQFFDSCRVQEAVRRSLQDPN